MPYKEVVVDLETLDTSNTAIIVSIGAVAFNREDNDSWDDFKGKRTFYEVLELDKQRAAGLTESASTLAWWKKQGGAAKEVFDAPKVDAVSVLLQFHTFCHGTNALWGNGNMFDNVIIRNACKQLGVPYPYEFWEDLDMRTVVSFAGGKAIASGIQHGVKHNALDDAKHEALVIQSCYRKLVG